MKIHEYQAKSLLRRNRVPVPRGYVVNSAIEAEFAMLRLKTNLAVVKAQIHAGGRGKAGGVKLVKSPTECGQVAGEMLGKTLVTQQTGASGQQVRRVYIEAGAEINRELYLALLIDREQAAIAIVASTQGGMDIEAVAAQDASQNRDSACRSSYWLEKFLPLSLDSCARLGRHAALRQILYFSGKPLPYLSSLRPVAVRNQPAGSCQRQFCRARQQGYHRWQRPLSAGKITGAA